MVVCRQLVSSDLLDVSFSLDVKLQTRQSFSAGNRPQVDAVLTYLKSLTKVCPESLSVRCLKKNKKKEKRNKSAPLNLSGQWDWQIMSVGASNRANENLVVQMSHGTPDTAPVLYPSPYSARHIFPDVLNYVALWTISK